MTIQKQNEVEFSQSQNIRAMSKYHNVRMGLLPLSEYLKVIDESDVVVLKREEEYVNDVLKRVEEKYGPRNNQKKRTYNVPPHIKREVKERVSRGNEDVLGMYDDKEQPVMTPGQYWIGDPSYLRGFREELWNYQTNHNSFHGNNPRVDEQNINHDMWTFEDGVYSVCGKRIAYLNTEHGDGVYLDNRGNRYGVDTGCLIGMKVSDIPESNNKHELNEGNIFRFNHPWLFYKNNGVLVFGDVLIDTLYTYGI